MRLRPSSKKGALASLLIALAAASGCVMLGQTAEAHDQWKKTYPLSPGGTVEISNTNGRIHVEPADGNTVEVVADRKVRAFSDEDAKKALGRIEIKETVSANRIALDSSFGPIGLDIDVSKNIDYTVKVPKWANVVLQATNGGIDVRGVGGKLRASTTNGSIKVASLEGPADASTTNGNIELEVNQIGNDGVTCETTNGSITLTVPQGAKATYRVGTNNGGIDTSGIEMAVSEKSRRELRATVGGGGPSVRLETTNGGIRIHGK